MLTKAALRLTITSFTLFSSTCLAATIEGRLRLQQVHQAPQYTSALQHRFLLKQQVELGGSTTWLVELINAIDTLQQQADFSPEHNLFDFHQINVSQKWRQQTLTLGRQVWSVGSQRLMGKREGTNVRRRFDGISVQSEFDNKGKLHGYHGYHVKSATGIFDDSPDWQMAVSGVQWQYANGLIHAMHFRDERKVDIEVRQSIEVEHDYQFAATRLFVHGIYQTGELQHQRVEAYFAQMALRWSRAYFDLSITASHASGGIAQRNNEFYSPFAKAPYYSEAGIFATTNLQHLGLTLSTTVYQPLSVSLDLKRLFVVNKDAAIYGQGKHLLITADQNLASPLAHTLDIVLAYPLTRHLKLEWVGSYMRPKSVVELQPGFFMEAVLNYRF